MEIMTIQKNIHTSPRKLRLVADLVRSMLPQQALEVLRFSKKSAAQDLAKVLKTVLANAKEQNLNEKELIFAKIEINEGLKYRRLHFGAKGRVRPYKKRLSHIKIVLSNKLGGDRRENETKKKEVKDGTQD